MNYLYFVSVAFLLLKSIVKNCINEIHAPYDFISNYYKFDTACYGVVSVLNLLSKSIKIKVQI